MHLDKEVSINVFWTKSCNLEVIPKYSLCFDDDLIFLKLTLCSQALFKKNGATFFIEMTGNSSLRIKGDGSTQIKVNSLSVHAEIHS